VCILNLPSDLLPAVLVIILIVALCWGFIIYLVWPEGCTRPYKAEEGKAICRDDLLPDDRKRFDDYMFKTRQDVADPLAYSTLLYLHSAAGDRANSAERASKIALEFAIAILVTTFLLVSGYTEFAQLAEVVLVVLGVVTITKSIWSEKILEWIYGKRNP